MLRGAHWRFLIPGLALAVIGAAAGAQAANRPPLASAALKVGQLTLHRCHTRAPWCATLVRPLDPSGAVPGTIPVYFEYYPHAARGPAAGTLVATEGGPGYPATGSREEYLTLFGPLRADYDVLIMDNRGTGHSGAIDCRPLQDAPALTEDDIGACGRALGRSAPFYSTTFASDDLAAILQALGIDRVNLYGDSYGTYFAQVFALRHPDRVRSLVLDGADPLDGPDYPWYPHYAPAMRDKFNLACERSPGCRALAGSSLEHIAPALQQLRIQPLQERVRIGAGRRFSFAADATALAIVMFGGAPALATVRETDAAARAFSAGDRLPLLRLMAETLTSVDSRDPTHAPEKFSAGLAAAVSCQDPPQIFDMSPAPAARGVARDRLIAQRRAQAPTTYAPFTIDEYRRMPLDYAFIDQCGQWPVSPAGPHLPLVPGGGSYPDIPVLVLSGDLDNMTSVADGAVVAAHFPRARHVVIANGFHVNALPHSRSECGASIARRFLARLATGDESCAAAEPPVRLVTQFARQVRELDPAQALADNEAGEDQLRAVSAALLTCADAITRAVQNGPGTGVGLRGGTFAAWRAAAGSRLDLRQLRWTEDLAVSGRVDWPGRAGVVHAHLTLRGSSRNQGTLDVTWPEGVSEARATVRGRLHDHAVVAAGPAP